MGDFFREGSGAAKQTTGPPMDVLRRFSSTGSIQAVKPIQRSRPDAPLQSSQGQIFQDLESRWDASAFEVEKTRCCPTLNISFLLALIVLVSTTSAALVIWGVMYGLNDSGYSELSESLQQNQVEFVVNSTNAFLELYTRQLVTVSEFLRVQWVKKGFIDVNDALEVTLAGAKAIASNCYVYYPPNRTFHGHGRSSVDAGIFVTFLQPNETGAYIYQSDSKGHALAFSQFVPKFDATQRPWYLTAFAAGAMSLSPIYPYADLSGVGTGFAVPVYRDGLLVANRSCSGYGQLRNMFPTETPTAAADRHRRPPWPPAHACETPAPPRSETCSSVGRSRSSSDSQPTAHPDTRAPQNPFRRPTDPRTDRWARGSWPPRQTRSDTTAAGSHQTLAQTEKRPAHGPCCPTGRCRHRSRWAAKRSQRCPRRPTTVHGRERSGWGDSTRSSCSQWPWPRPV